MYNFIVCVCHAWSFTQIPFCLHYLCATRIRKFLLPKLHQKYSHIPFMIIEIHIMIRRRIIIKSNKFAYIRQRKISRFLLWTFTLSLLPLCVRNFFISPLFTHTYEKYYIHLMKYVIYNNDLSPFNIHKFY